MERREQPTRKILVLPPIGLYAEIMSPAAERALASLGEVDRNMSERDLSRKALLERVADADAVLTSWGAPAFDEELLDRAPKLKIIGHAAGSVKRLVGSEAFDRGIAVTHAAATIADSVGEWALTVTLAALRRAVDFDRIMRPPLGVVGEPSHERPNGWGPEKRAVGYGNELYGKRVGIIGASMTGRAFIRLLQPFGCDVVVYDPYLAAAPAAEMGVRKVSDLGELTSTCAVTSNHAPTTPETTGMVSAAQLARMQEGALFVNTARAAAVDYAALTRELVSGRIRAALDVFPQEPLAADSPLRALPNVLLSPHVAGATVESRRRLGATVVEDFARFFAGQPLRYGVTREQLAIMA